MRGSPYGCWTFRFSPLLLRAFAEVLCLWVEAVWPAPARYEIGFVGFESYGEILNMFFWRRSRADEGEMRGDPGKIERGERAEKVTAVYGAQAVGEDEVVNDARPEIVGHAKVFGLKHGKLLEAEQRVGRQDE